MKLRLRIIFIIKSRFVWIFSGRLRFYSAKLPEKNEGELYFFYDYCSVQPSLQAPREPQEKGKAKQELN